MKPFKLEYNSETGDIKINGKVVGCWDDEAHFNYPEDIIWSRTISHLFTDGVQAGYELAKEEQNLEQENYKSHLSNLLRHLKTSTDLPDPVFAVYVSPAESMRRAAIEIEKRDKDIKEARAALENKNEISR